MQEQLRKYAARFLEMRPNAAQLVEYMQRANHTPTALAALEYAVKQKFSGKEWQSLLLAFRKPHESYQKTIDQFLLKHVRDLAQVEGLELWHLVRMAGRHDLPPSTSAQLKQAFDEVKKGKPAAPTCGSQVRAALLSLMSAGSLKSN